MKNVKLKIISNAWSDTCHCHEMICDLRMISVRVNKNAVNNLLLSLTYTLEYEYNDLITKCYNARIVKYQVDSDDENSVFIKFAYSEAVVTKSKYKILKDTVESLMNNSDSRLICLNLDRQAGHTSTLLWLMDKNPNAILVVKSNELKNRAMNMARDLRYKVTNKNIVVINEGVNIPSLFEGSKFDMILIDDFSFFTKNCIEKIIYHTRRENGDKVRYVCLG